MQEVECKKIWILYIGNREHGFSSLLYIKGNILYLMGVSYQLFMTSCDQDFVLSARWEILILNYLQKLFLHQIFNNGWQDRQAEVIEF